MLFVFLFFLFVIFIFIFCSLFFYCFLGWSSLHFAILSKSKEMVQFLLTQGGDLNLTDARQWSALHYAMDMSLSEIVSLLLEKGASLDVQTRGGDSAFFLGNN
jgi:ankyrin repeat protein